MSVSELTMDDTNDLWDVQSLVDTVGDDTELIVSLTELFVEDSGHRLATLERAVTDGDLDVVRREAHTLKGAAGNIRATRARKAASLLEASAREGKLADTARYLCDLKSELSALYARFRTFVQRALS